MRHINEVASWFNKNNILKKNEKEDNLRINLLCLYTKVAYTIKGLELECDEISFDEKLNINIGITNLNLETEFTAEELRILKTINREYGYLKITDLLFDFSIIDDKLCHKVICEKLKNDIEDHLEGYESYNFDEKTIIIKKNVFFVNKEVEVTEKLIEELSNYYLEGQYIFNVFKGSTEEGLLIY